jgi:AI-2 transport protein TqsA
VNVESRVQTICLMILATVAMGAALFWLKPVLIPLTLAVFVSIAIGPLVDLQTRWLRMPRFLALVSTLLIVLVTFSLATMMLSSSVNQLAATSSDYERQVNLMVDRVSEMLPAELRDRISEEDMRSLTRIPTGSIGRLLAQTTNAILGVLSQGFVVFIFVTFLLAGGGQWSREETGIMGDVVSPIRRYLVVSVAISASTGVLVGFVLMLLGVPLATVFGLMAFLLNFIPTIGSIIATLLPLPVVIISADISFSVAVLALGLPGVIQLVIGNLIAPKVLGDSLDLHPVTILSALIFWGTLWGIMGMLLATPITAVIKILLERVPSARPIAELMAGRMGGGGGVGEAGRA